MDDYYEVRISAENQLQANKIIDSLLNKKLVTGGQFVHQPARFLWKRKVIDINYVMINSYTKHQNVDIIIEDVRLTTEEEVPMITFVKIDRLNSELASWIDLTLGSPGI